MGRKIKYKPNDYILPCPKCGNNTEFKIHSQQVCEDGCEIWAECKCGHVPAENSNDRIDDVWGGCSDENCLDAISITWNELIRERNDERIVESKAQSKNQTPTQ